MDATSLSMLIQISKRTREIDVREHSFLCENLLDNVCCDKYGAQVSYLEDGVNGFLSCQFLLFIQGVTRSSYNLIAEP